MAVRTQKARRILARTPPELFVGRVEQARELSALASPKAGQQSLLLLAAPQSGVSELLRQTFDELFRQRGGASPVYFAFSRSDAATTAAARRSLAPFLTHTIAHRRDAAAPATATPTLRALLDLAPPADYEWAGKWIQPFDRALG